MESNNHVPFNYHVYFAQFNSPYKIPVIREVANCCQEMHERIQEAVFQSFKYIHKHLEALPLNKVIYNIIELGTHTERGFNIAEVIPVLGTLTSAMRMTVGKIQFLAGAICASLNEGAHLVASRIGVDKKLLHSFRKLRAVGLEFMIHGALNIIRGAGGLFMGTCTLGIGSIILIVPNMINYRNFTPYFAYGTLIDKHLRTCSESSIG